MMCFGVRLESASRDAGIGISMKLAAGTLHNSCHEETTLRDGKTGLRSRFGGILASIRAAVTGGRGREIQVAQSEDELAAVSYTYWNEGDKLGVDLGDYSHWRGRGPWADDEKWLALGRVHFEMYKRLLAYAGMERPIQSVLEWGSGGGANAIHFVSHVNRYCGVEISQSSLDECARVLADAGFERFEPVLISASTPEEALRRATGDFGLFLSTYVFELIPGRVYGERIARVAFSLLRPGGLALIQIRYDDGSDRSNQKASDYFRNACRFTSYRIEDFWRRMEAIGYRPLYVTLIPRKIDGFSGDLYAYFAMQKPAA